MGGMCSKPKASNDELSTDAEDPNQLVCPSLFTYLTPSKNLSRIISKYWAWDCQDLDSKESKEIKPHFTTPRITQNLKFFDHSSLAAVAGQAILFGDAKTTIEIAEKLSKKDKKQKVLARDMQGRQVYGNLLEIAAFAGSFNPRLMNSSEENFGIFEQLVKYYSSGAVKEALTKAYFTPDDTGKKRTQRIIDAVHELGNAIMRTNSSQDSIENDCKHSIDNFRTLIKPNQNETITSGLIFDPEILNNFKIFLENNIAHFGGWYHSNKTNLFLVVGYGALQSLVSADDALAIHLGISEILYSQKSLIRTDLSGYYSNENGLGNSIFVDDSGWWRGPGYQSAYFLRALGSTGQWNCWGNYINNKKASVNKIYQQAHQSIQTNDNPTNEHSHTALTLTN